MPCGGPCRSMEADKMPSHLARPQGNRPCERKRVGKGLRFLPRPQGYSLAAFLVGAHKGLALAQLQDSLPYWSSQGAQETFKVLLVSVNMPVKT